MNRILTTNEPEPQPEKPAAPKAKGGPAWGYRAADNERGWEGQIFDSREAAHAAGWLESPADVLTAKTVPAPVETPRKPFQKKAQAPPPAAEKEKE